MASSGSSVIPSGPPIVLRDEASGSVAPQAEVLRTLLDAGYSVSYRIESGQEDSASADALDVTGAQPEAALDAARQWTEKAATPAPGTWKPWFPVIDYDRCTDCMQCLSFCLFDVYGVDADSHIQVKNPANCKTNCPACSRVCPEVAILFPKYGAGPINGDAVKTEDIEREKMKVDISSLLGGDIYTMLRERHEHAGSRFAKERDESKALKERLRCLKKLQEELDIPAEALQALPSQDEIRARAQAAAEEARRATSAGENDEEPTES